MNFGDGPPPPARSAEAVAASEWLRGIRAACVALTAALGTCKAAFPAQSLLGSNARFTCKWCIEADWCLSRTRCSFRAYRTWSLCLAGSGIAPRCEQRDRGDAREGCRGVSECALVGAAYLFGHRVAREGGMRGSMQGRGMLSRHPPTPVQARNAVPPPAGRCPLPTFPPYGKRVFSRQQQWD